MGHLHCTWTLFRLQMCNNTALAICVFMHWTVDTAFVWLVICPHQGSFRLFCVYLCFCVFLYFCICALCSAVVWLVVCPHQGRFRQQLGTGLNPRQPPWCPAWLPAWWQWPAPCPWWGWPGLTRMAMGRGHVCWCKVTRSYLNWGKMGRRKLGKYGQQPPLGSTEVKHSAMEKSWLQCGVEQRSRPFCE